jgi:hypothetical protein
MLTNKSSVLHQHLIAAICVFVPILATAQELPFPAGAQGDPEAVAKVLPALADQLTVVYKEDTQAKYLDNLFRLQIVCRHADASKSVVKLREVRVDPRSSQSNWYNVQDQILVRAKIIENREHIQFDEAFQRAFRENLKALNNRTSALVIRQFNVPGRSLRADFENAVAKQKGKNTISITDALALVRAYQIAEEFRAFAPLANSLIDEDDNRRYFIQRNIQVKTLDGATICVHVMRSRNAPVRLPTLMQFTIYNDPDQSIVARDLRRTASNDYASVVGFTRGKACSPDEPVPYEHDGADAAALIDWISKQSWSDGRVGMV